MVYVKPPEGTIASAARIADPRPHQDGQSNAWFLARVRYQSAARPGRDETLVRCSGGARVAFG